MFHQKKLQLKFFNYENDSCFIFSYLMAFQSVRDYVDRIVIQHKMQVLA